MSGQPMSVQSWRVGDVKITKLAPEGEGSVPWEMIPDATPEALLPMKWLQPHFVTDTGEKIYGFQVFLLETSGLKIVVDTCVGNDKPRGEIPGLHMLQGPFLEVFEKVCCRREDVDVVLCTHLHADHVGWNTMLVDGNWLPTFPNARYLFGRKEFEVTRDEAENGSDSFEDGIRREIFNDSIQPVVDAGLVDLVETTHVVSPEVRLTPTDGHSPGHVSVVITSRDQRAFITGDLLHHPCQVANPQWPVVVDYNVDAAIATRKRFCEEMADSDVMVIGTHWPTPTAGWVVRDGGTYRLRLEDAASSNEEALSRAAPA